MVYYHARSDLETASLLVRQEQKKDRPRLTEQRHREEPEAGKLIEACPIDIIEQVSTIISASMKIRGFLSETYGEILQTNY